MTSLRWNWNSALLIFQLAILCNQFHISTCDLKSSDVRELPCPNLGSIGLVTDLFAVPFISTPSTYYYLPMASSFTFRHYAEILLGHSAVDQSQLNQMLYHGFLLTTTAVNTGYCDKFFFQQCQPTSLTSPFQALCVPTISSLGSDTSIIATSVDSAVWTDMSTAVLITRCVNNAAYDWAVWSPYPTLSNSVQAAVLQKVGQIGFNISLAEYTTY